MVRHYHHQLQQEDSPPTIEAQEEQEITIPSHNRARVECLKCHKPAVRYHIHHKDGTADIVYEHRDETPTKWYKYRNKMVPRYRRCSAGSSVDAMKIIFEAGQEPEEEAEMLQEQQQEQQQEEPAPSNTIVGVPLAQRPGTKKIGKIINYNPPDKINYKHPLPNKGGHRPSGAELYKMLRSVQKEQQGLREDQHKIFKELNAIRSVMEMMIKGDVTLTPKAVGAASIGIG